MVLTLIIGGGLAYLNVSNSGSTVFGWLSNLTSLLTLFGWGMICASHLRMRYAWKVQGRSPSELPWKSWTYPVGAWWGLFWCILLIIVEFYLSVWPLEGNPSAKTFFSNYVSVVAVIVIYIGAMIYYKGPLLNDARTIDLDKFRRFYVDHHDEEAKAEKTGVKKYLSKGLGFVFN